MVAIPFKTNLQKFTRLAARPATVGERLEFEDISLDPEAHRVARGGLPVKLGPTEFRLLNTFMEKPGRVWTREQLLDRV